MRRPRGPGGRFLTGEEIRALEAQQAAQPAQNQQQSSQLQLTNETNGNSIKPEPVNVAAAEGVEA